MAAVVVERNMRRWLRVLALGLTVGGCATPSAAHTWKTAGTPPEEPQAAAEASGESAPADAPAREVLPAPPPAGTEDAPEPSTDGEALAAAESAPPPSQAPSPEAFTPQSSPLLATVEKGPHGDPPDAVDPLWKDDRDARRRARSSYGYGYASPYYGYGYAAPYYGYGGLYYGYRPYYGYYGYPYYRPGFGLGFGLGVGFGRYYGWGRYRGW